MVKQLLVLSFILIVCGENIFYAKEISENPLSHKNLVQNTKHLSNPHKQGRNDNKNLKTRNWSQRCSIFCPLVIVFPTNSNDMTLVIENVTTPSTVSSKVTPMTVMTSSPLLNVTSNKTVPETKNRRKSNKRIRKMHPTQRRKYFVLTNVTDARNKLGIRKYRGKYTYHGLSLRQKRLLLKQLNLGNAHGKKPYEFKQISTSLCRVVCQEENGHSNTPAPDRDSTENGDSDEDSEDDDTYEEGEDTPIEATVKPFVPPSVVIGGIRPFGSVNFNGFDDFGPNGELAKDIPQLLED